MRILATITLALLSLNIGVAAFGDDDDETTYLKGKVINSEGRAVPGAKIIVQNEDTHEEITGKADSDGAFEVEHAPCSTISFDVVPGEKSGLSMAHYSHVAGEISKYFSVQLRRGFRVTGKVMAEGQGIKGLEIRAIGLDGSDTSATIHGGGLTHSKVNGEYVLLLTPGKKTIQIKNDIFSNLSPLYQHDFTITGDVRLPDMTLPLIKE